MHCRASILVIRVKTVAYCARAIQQSRSCRCAQICVWRRQPDKGQVMSDVKDDAFQAD